jgi:hypothetical protein
MTNANIKNMVKALYEARRNTSKIFVRLLRDLCDLYSNSDSDQVVAVATKMPEAIGSIAKAMTEMLILYESATIVRMTRSCHACAAELAQMWLTSTDDWRTVVATQLACHNLEAGEDPSALARGLSAVAFAVHIAHRDGRCAGYCRGHCEGRCRAL